MHKQNLQQFYQIYCNIYNFCAFFLLSLFIFAFLHYCLNILNISKFSVLIVTQLEDLKEFVIIFKQCIDTDSTSDREQAATVVGQTNAIFAAA